MAVEIERKFTVKQGFKPESKEQIRIAQAYLSSDINTTIRVRLANEKAYFTVKGKTDGISRLEFEYEVPFEDAEQMMKLAAGASIDKVRHIYWHEGKKWEVDVFAGENEGLIVAECELASEEEAILLPDWIEQEVSGDPRYHNSYLANNPYKTWSL
ncbi:MAG: CYTH domain-containing protein [Mangrovibacterium sp.]